MKRKLASLLSSLLVLALLLTPCALAAEATTTYTLPEQGIAVTLPADYWMDTRDEQLTEYGINYVADETLFSVYGTLADAELSIEATIEPMAENEITGAAGDIDEETAAVLALFGIGDLSMPESFKAMSDKELKELAAAYNKLMSVAMEMFGEDEEMAMLMALLGDDLFATYSCKNGKYLTFDMALENTTAVDGVEVAVSAQVLCYMTVENGQTYTYIFTTTAPASATAAFTKQAKAVIDSIVYTAPVEPIRYEDTVKHWARHDIGRAIREGFFDAATVKFLPEEAATRAMLVTALYRAAGNPAAGECPFPDVAADATYAAAATWAYEAGIIKGDDGKFNADGSLEREQLAAIFQRYTAWKGHNTSLWTEDFWGEFGEYYPDNAKISSWARESMAWAAENALITGDEHGNLTPQGNTTRAELACVLMRYLDNEAEGYFVAKTVE